MFIYFITLRLISTRILSRGKEKKVSGDHRTFAAKQIQFSYFTRFYYTVIRSEKLEVTSFPIFLSSIKSDDGYQIGGRVSPDTPSDLVPREMFRPMSARKNKVMACVENLCTVKQW